jgi:hypothetical protein
MSVVSSREKSPSARCELRDTIGVEFWMMVFFSAQQGIDKCFNLKLSRFLNDDVHNWKDWNIGRGWEMIDITAGRGPCSASLFASHALPFLHSRRAVTDIKRDGIRTYVLNDHQNSSNDSGLLAVSSERKRLNASLC